MYKSILVPVDIADSAVALPAIEAARGFLQGSDARLRLVTVLSLIPSTFMDYVPPDFDALQRQRAEDALRDIATKTGVPPQQVSTVVRMGGVYPEVLAEADDWKADLVIIGSHRPAMSTYLLGSNAATIVRHATCSVLVVRGPKS